MGGSPSHDKENNAGLCNRDILAPSKSPLMNSRHPTTAEEGKPRRRDDPSASRHFPQEAEKAGNGVEFQDTAETSHCPSTPELQTVLPENVLRQKLQDMIRICRKQREDRADLAEQLFSDQAWVKDTRRASEALQKKEEIINQLNQLVSALQHAEQEENARNVQLLTELDEAQATSQADPGPQKVKLSGAQLTMTEALPQPTSPVHSHSLLSDLSTRQRQHRCSSGSAAVVQGRGKPAWGGHGAGGLRADTGPLTAGVRGSYRRCVYREEKERESGQCLEVFAGKHVLRTVCLSGRDGDALSAALESLSQRFEALQGLATERATLHTALRRTRWAEYHRRLGRYGDSVVQLKRSLRTARKNVAQHDAKIPDLRRRLDRLMTQSKAEQLSMERELTSCTTTRDRMQDEWRRRQTEAAAQYEWYRGAMNAESKAREAKVEEVKSRYASAQRQYQAQIDALEADFDEEKRRLKALQDQRDFIRDKLTRQVVTLRDDVRTLQTDCRALGALALFETMDNWLLGPLRECV